MRKKFSLDDLYYMVSHIYSEQNYQRSVTATFAHFVEVCGMLTAFSRNKHRDSFNFESAICRSLGWFFPLLSKCGVVSLEEIVFRKFPYVCPYCRQMPHVDRDCKTVKGDTKTVNHEALRVAYLKNSRKKPSSLNDWQEMFQDIYPRNADDRTRSAIGLMEELGELAEAIRIYDRHPKFFAGEVADVFSYLMGVANEYSIRLQTQGLQPLDLEKEFLQRYPGMCSACGNTICSCPAVPEATIGRMTKELEIGEDEKLFGCSFESYYIRGSDVSYDVIDHIGGISSIIDKVSLDRGQINQSLVFICMKIAEVIYVRDRKLSMQLRDAALTIASKTTPPGAKVHDRTVNDFIGLIREAIRELPDLEAMKIAEREDKLVTVVSSMVSKYRVLVVTSSPEDLDHVDVSGEARAIINSVERSKHRDNIFVKILPAATIDDLRHSLLENQYDIVHICGHGCDGIICMRDDSGESISIALESLKGLLSRYENIRVVIINTCSTLDSLNEAIAPYTIGMRSDVSDNAAIEFSKGFYDAIGAGKSIEFAISEGRENAKAHGEITFDEIVKVLKSQ